MKFIPNDKIAGYGPSAHSNFSIGGPFSFGVAPEEIGGGGGQWPSDPGE